MDIVTQGLLGSAVSVSGAEKNEIKKAAGIGAFAGVLADADIFIRSTSDPLLTLEYHRQFTHALVFIPIGALFAACIVWCLFRLVKSTALPFKRVYYYALLGYLLSGILDACTSYGTQLLWPFSDMRVAWSLISIIDPIFSGVLILALVLAIKTQCLHAIRSGLALCLLYLGISSYQSTIVRSATEQLAEKRGHEIERLIVKPTFGNIILWRTVYLYDGVYYVDAVRSLFDLKVFDGESIQAIDVDNGFPQLNKDSTQYQDVLRFNYFSNGYLARSLENETQIGDVRYSIFPLSTQPLWGIEINPVASDEHVAYVTNRQLKPEQRQKFFHLLFGKANSE